MTLLKARAPLSEFAFLDIKIQGSEPPFTIDSMRKLMSREGPKQYFLILGEDSLERLHEWKEIEELIALAPPLIGSRGGGSHF